MTGDPGKALPEAAADRSSRMPRVRGVFGSLEPLWIALLIAGLLGALLMIAAEFTTLRSVKVITASCTDLADPGLRGECVTSGYEEHAFALLLIGLGVMVMAWGATLGRSRPAGVALALLGATVLAIAFLIDVPDVHKSGVLGARFESARATAGPGLYLEIAGGTMAFVAGIVATVARPAGMRRRDRKQRRRREKRARARAEA